MIQLSKGGAYLLGGMEVIEDSEGVEELIKAKAKGRFTSKEDAAKGTMAYNILQAHNTSGNMDKLQIKFDKLTSHDITFVGIIQTARASGLEKFPVPYVLTNCHNSLCAVGGTINEDDH
ncbi:MAG: hydratase, partial [Eubacterium sp.]